MTKHFTDLRIEGEKKGGGSSRTPKEAKNTLRSKAIARVLDALGEGDIGGLVNGGKSIFFDGTPLENDDGSVNFEGVVWHERTGEPDQDPVPGFNAAENVVLLGGGNGVTVENGTPVIRTIADPDLDAIRVTLGWAALTDLNEKKGDLNGSSVAYRISVQASGEPYVTVVDTTITGKTVSPYERSYRVPLTGAAPWNVKVERLTEDAPNSTVTNAFAWLRYTELTESKLYYPDTALVGVAVDAELFGSTIPTRAYEIYGRLVMVPSNYDPIGRTYAGIWDGTFKKAWTDNPAWVFYDLTQNTRYGIGDLIDTSLVDKWALYEIAQYCDQLVDDGYGAQKPRFTFNGLVQGEEDALNVLQAIASVFRGCAFYANGAIICRADKPEEPSKLVAPANVVEGEFVYSGSALKARHTVAMVTWNDPNDEYRQAIEVYEDPDAIERYGWRPIEITAYGCTSKAQAYRLAKWTLFTEQRQTDTVTYSAGLDHADLFPFDVVSLADPAFADVRMGGRVKSFDPATNTIVLDAPITMNEGETYELAVVMPDGEIGTANLALTVGAQDTFNVAALPADPEAGAMWAVTASDVAPRQFRVQTIAETSPTTFEITALLEAPEKFPFVDSGILFDAAPSRANRQNAPAGPTEIAFDESTRFVNGLPVQVVTVSWKHISDPFLEGYNVRVQEPGGEWLDYGTVKEASVVIRGAVSGEYLVTIVAIARGVLSQEVSATYTVVGKTTKPDPVENLQAVGDFRAIRLTWSLPAGDNALGGVAIYEASTDDRAAAVEVARVAGTSFTRTGLAGLETRFYWARTFDTSGNLSDFNSNLGTSATTTQATHDDLVQQIIDESILAPSLMNRIAATEVNATELANFYAKVDQTLTNVAAYETRIATIEDWKVTFDDGSTQYITEGQLLVAKDETRAAAVAEVNSVYLGPDGVVAQQVNSLRSEVDENMASLELDAQTIDGLKAQYTVKVDVNGYVAGYGIAAEEVDGVPSSEFTILADRFSVAQPGVSGGVQYPFIITTVNGQSVVSMNSAFITEVVSATLKSPDNKFRIDLENKTLSIEV
ncbi:phage tail protein [Salipiger pacificus]|nr:phage tail protein [Alloyangia pacifica]